MIKVSKKRNKLINFKMSKILKYLKANCVIRQKQKSILCLIKPKY